MSSWAIRPIVPHDREAIDHIAKLGVDYEREGWRPTGEERFGRDLGLQIVEYARAL